MLKYDVVLVGAGIAGLAAAQVLTQAGLSVCVLEKSRGLGGDWQPAESKRTMGKSGLIMGHNTLPAAVPALKNCSDP